MKVALQTLVKRYLFALALLSPSCAAPNSTDSKAAPDSKVGPSFDTLNAEQLRTEMGALATDVRNLDLMLRRRDGSPAQAVAVLRHMEDTVVKLRGAKDINAHPRLVAELGVFAKDVRAAREAAEAEPPDYFLAGTIAGSCSYCHP